MVGRIQRGSYAKANLFSQASTLDPKKKLALAICDFLSTSLKDGTINADDSENIEIATNCIAESFQIDPTNTSQVKEAVGAQSLLQIYSVYDKLKAANPVPSSSSSSKAPPSSTSATKDAPKPSSASAGGNPSSTTPESESLKSKGNEAMRAHDYTDAIHLYTSALKIAPTNPIYLSNRAAAYSAQQNYSSAASDAELAIASDPNYAKAWSRLGAAKYALAEYESSVEAYEKAVEIDGSEMSKKGLETARKKLSESAKEGAGPEEDIDDAPGDERAAAPSGGGAGGMPDLGALAGMLGGGGGGGGGMPDLAGLMQNPMMAQMAQKFMQNPEALSGLMQNPQVRAMAENMGLGGMGGAGGADGAGGAGRGGGAGAGAGAGRGGGGPDIAAMMQDPALQDM